MEMNDALAVLAALGQGTRLAIFRLLVRAAPDGLAAGEISATLDTPPATLSFHLAQLGHAGLVTASRRGRSIRYRVAFATMRHLLAYLTEDCCQGRPEVRGPDAAASTATGRDVDSGGD